MRRNEKLSLLFSLPIWPSNSFRQANRKKAERKHKKIKTKQKKTTTTTNQSTQSVSVTSDSLESVQEQHGTKTKRRPHRRQRRVPDLHFLYSHHKRQTEDDRSPSKKKTPPPGSRCGKQFQRKSLQNCRILLLPLHCCGDGKRKRRSLPACSSRLFVATVVRRNARMPSPQPPKRRKATNSLGCCYPTVSDMRRIIIHWTATNGSQFNTLPITQPPPPPPPPIYSPKCGHA